MNIEDLAVGSLIANDQYAWIKHGPNTWRLACNSPGYPVSDFSMSEAIRMGATLLRVGLTMDPIALLAKATAACNQASEEIDKLNALLGEECDSTRSELRSQIAVQDDDLDSAQQEITRLKAELAQAIADRDVARAVLA